MTDFKAFHRDIYYSNIGRFILSGILESVSRSTVMQRLCLSESSKLIASNNHATKRPTAFHDFCCDFHHFVKHFFADDLKHIA